MMVAIRWIVMLMVLAPLLASADQKTPEEILEGKTFTVAGMCHVPGPEGGMYFPCKLWTDEAKNLYVELFFQHTGDLGAIKKQYASDLHWETLWLNPDYYSEEKEEKPKPKPYRPVKGVTTA